MGDQIEQVTISFRLETACKQLLEQRRDTLSAIFNSCSETSLDGTLESGQLLPPLPTPATSRGGASWITV